MSDQQRSHKRPVSRAIFLDRDGVCNVLTRGSYINSPAQFELYRLVPEAIVLFRSMGFKVYVVTNQAGVAKGHLTRNTYDQITTKFRETLHKFGTKVDDVYACFHHTYEDCGCRKPRPGMILKAATQHKISLLHSYMIGDNITDVQAGISAGIPFRNCLLVKTGLGNDYVDQMHDQSLVFKNLWNAMIEIKAREESNL